jgi:hypothetical protein
MGWRESEKTELCGKLNKPQGASAQEQSRALQINPRAGAAFPFLSLSKNLLPSVAVQDGTAVLARDCEHPSPASHLHFHLLVLLPVVAVPPPDSDYQPPHSSRGISSSCCHCFFHCQ